MSGFKYTDAVTGEIVQIPVRLLAHHPDNPRKDLGDLSELTESVKARGILQNLTVVPGPIPKGTGWQNGYTVVIGNRRMEAAKAAGLETVPCVIAKMSDAEQIQTMLMENMQRSDLTVYEQAQGFQMMIDFGDTAEGVSEKTGFSETTIRKRLKIAELDQETLKTVSTRQVTLGDFDLLAKIDDLSKRNEVLTTVGTDEFRVRYQQALTEQEIAKKLPSIREKVAVSGARELKSGDSGLYTGEYMYAGPRIYISNWDGGEVVPQDVKKPLYYCLDEYSGTLQFFTKREKREAVKRTEAEIEQEKTARKAADELKELSAACYRAREAFAKTITVTAKTRPKLLLWMSRAILFEVCEWSTGTTSLELAAAFGLDEESFDDEVQYRERFAYLAKMLDEDEGLIPLIIWKYLGDSEDGRNSYFTITETMLQRGEMPVFCKNKRLDLVYEYLCDFGYRLSSDEEAMTIGTLPQYAKDNNEEDAEE